MIATGGGVFADGLQPVRLRLFHGADDGKTSAVLSLFRTLIFLIVPLLILPELPGVDGVWISMPVAEVLSVLLAVFYFRRMKGKYHYA